MENKLQIMTLEVLLGAIAGFEHSCKEITMGVSKIMFTIAILLYLFGCLHGVDSQRAYFSTNDCKFFEN
jgi:high-affinity nickel permease